jgi:pimeloyl-ACP methyl ester carboxylesterase
MVFTFLLGWWQYVSIEPTMESGTLRIDPPTPFIKYSQNPASAAPTRQVLVIHGLDVSKEVMHLLSAALADAGFPVYSIDLPGHGDSKARFQTELAEQAIRNTKAFLGGEISVVGHSLGAGLLLDLAETEEFSTLVLLSPPPLAISEIRAQRVLIATGNLDLPTIRQAVSTFTDIGRPHVESWILPWAAHAAPIMNPHYVRRVIDWLGGDGGKARTGARIFWSVLMFVSAVAFGFGSLRSRGLMPVKRQANVILAIYALACGASLAVLKILNPFWWLHLFATDYLVGFVSITGLIVLSIQTKAARSLYAPSEEAPLVWNISWRSVLQGVACAAFLLAVPGGMVVSRFLHLSLTDGRWWRFPCILLSSLPLFMADEITIRRLQPRWKSETIGLLTRVLFLAFLLTGTLTLNRDDAFLVLIVPLIVIFWIGLWFCSGAVHRHTQDPIAAALFASIVQGWAFAAWFVTI